MFALPFSVFVQQSFFALDTFCVFQSDTSSELRIIIMCVCLDVLIPFISSEEFFVSERRLSPLCIVAG